MSGVLTAILAFLAPIIKDVITDVLKEYLKERSHKVIEETASAIEPEAVHSVYNPSEHLDKYDRMLEED